MTCKVTRFVIVPLFRTYLLKTEDSKIEVAKLHSKPYVEIAYVPTVKNCLQDDII